MTNTNQDNLNNEHSAPEGIPAELEVRDFENTAGITEAGSLNRRRLLLLLLLLLLVLLACVSVLFFRYLKQPAPLPELVVPQQIGINYPPHYLFSIYGIENPIGIALSPSGDRIYVTESGGERLVRVFDRDGDPIGVFNTPNTNSGERSPVYLATDSNGYVYVSDRLQHAVFVFDRDGNLLDAILGPDLTLSEYITQQTGKFESGAKLTYNVYRPEIFYLTPTGVEESLPQPEPVNWAPLGVRIGTDGVVYLTDVDKDRNQVREISLGNISTKPPWSDFNPTTSEYGESGSDNGQFLFPNSAMPDSQGRVYVSDGNNGRITVWDANGKFLFNFGSGSGESGLSLPRGIYVDQRDRLHVVDAVGQNIKVYDVSGSEPAFLYAFGDLGLDDGLFNFPNDIAIDDSGRLYITDRENNRVQVWSY